MKLVVQEPESNSLRGYLGDRPDLVSSTLLRAEAVRAIRSLGAERLRRTRRLLTYVRFVPTTETLLDASGMLDPAIIRTLDAIHLASAMSLGDELDVIVTYDGRMIDGARLLGIPVAAPS